MTVANKSLVLDFIEWVASGPRTYAEAMDAWRTSCPRLTIWEDSVDLGFVVVRHETGGALVDVTAAGRAFLDSERVGL